MTTTHRPLSETSPTTKQLNMTLKTLKNDPSIVILPADKGRCVVVMDTAEYKEKIEALLSDESTYIKITDKRRNPTSHVEKDLNKLLQDIKKQPSGHDSNKPQLPDKLYYHLHSTDALPAAFYGLPKIDKPEIPLRPITSCISFATYNLSSHLVHILSPLQTRKFSVKNSSEFSSKIAKHPIPDDAVMVSFDVVSLFTSIPVELALSVVQRRLDDDKDLQDRTDISRTNILRLLKFVLTNSYFTYENTYYQQIFGCAMGSPISATVANIIMEHIEDQAITSAAHPPIWWFRFVDDSHTGLHKDHVQEFHDHLNSINPHIQFTIEMEQDNKLAFLDTITYRKDGHIQIKVYRKTTHTDKYLDFNSHHPATHKRSVVNTLLDRADNIPSTRNGKRKERKHVMKVLQSNGYSTKFIKNCDTMRKCSKDRTNNENDSAGLVVLPYIQGVSERIARVLRRENLKVGYKPIRTLNNCFPKPKDKPNIMQSREVIYQINCQNCEFVYIGQTERALRTRLKEHQRAIIKQDKNSKLAQHATLHKHSIDLKNPKIIDKANNYRQRLFLEAWHSQRATNAGSDHIELPGIYVTLN
ncbi:uncharacterized protein LOC114544426 [Dendronephthya gigantea]|uniref:uncharacterized protein LOC114543768 n=1 Tax=Dendronephthya gigantea TaxID=151771 RepID=UPI00106A3D19|nr:uncharacterized protein LOC114543768 [Dendronephthya gigantea]XP_028418875.1 uncharacterized protein LOC114544426 [Dendronephthya gigantea]